MTTTVEPTQTAAPSTGGGILRHLNFGTAIIGGGIFGFIGWLLAYAVLDKGGRGFSDQMTVLTAVGWTFGFELGIGAFTGMGRWFTGADPSHEDDLYYAGKDLGRARYWKFTTDHKVVGVQYIVVTMILLGVGGILAMALRTNLITPGNHFINQQAYNALISVHGMVMILALIVAVAGPWANFVVPIMVGARDMAFPRLNALSLWTLVAAIPLLVGSLALGGLDTGWVTQAPLSDQAGPGFDFFAMSIVVFTVSTTVAGINTICTVLTMRTKGMTLERLPIFVWASMFAAGLGLYAFPFFLVVMSFNLSDRMNGTSFFIASGGGTGWLQENLFWLMGHPEVYVILIPAVGALMEITTVFARKPLFSYRTAIGGMAALVGLSALVWAHHMFTTGWAPTLGGPFMLTTELISIPTGVIFLVILGTLWRGNIWMRLPMFWVFGFIFNFIVGGITGIYLSDIPLDNQLHGTMFVVAHFHYVFVGSVLFGAIGALCFWFPKVTGRYLNETMGKTSFWLVFTGVQVTFLSMFISGLKGMPRRDSSYAIIFEHTNFISTMGAYVIMAGMLVLLGAIVTSWSNGEPSGPNPWHAKSLEWMVPTPVPLENFEVLPVITSDPYTYGEDRDEELVRL